MLFRFLKLSIVTASFCSLSFSRAQIQEEQHSNNTPASVNVTFLNGATILGESNDGVDSFLGIQYGLVGERFSKSTLVNIMDDTAVVINATAFGSDCYQSVPELPEFVHQPRMEAEECLFLNIWHPSNISSEDSSVLPIMVWIHGGGFIIGSGAEQQYNGSNLSRTQNVMVISINYRLGALGFLPQDSYGTGAMNGILDQILALQWIQVHARAFGGNIEQVTVFGESSGSESVCMLSVSPLSKGLFHRAIMQSGDCIYNPWMLGVPNEDIDFALQAVDSLMNATGVSSMEELQNASLVDAATLNQLSVTTGLSIPVLDKQVLPQHPRELYQEARNIVPSDFLIGSNSNEDLTFWGMTADYYLDLAASDGGLNESVQSLVGSRYGSQVAEQVLKAYDADINYNGDTALSFSHFHGDWYIGCPSRAFATDIAQVLLNPLSGGNVSHSIYLYHFAHFSILDPLVHFGYLDYVNTTGWASHMAEIPFVFGTMDFWIPTDVIINKTEISTQDYEMNVEMMTRWANFAKTGNPNGDNNNELFVIWEPISSTKNPPLLLLFEEGQSRMSKLDVKAKQCSAFPFGNDNNDDDDNDDEVIASGSNRANADTFWLMMMLSIGFFGMSIT